MASDSNFTQQALETVETASFKLRTDTDNVAGVLLPVFKIDNAGNSFFELMGLGRGGTEIRKSVKHYERALDVLVQLASLQTSFVTLDEVGLFQIFLVVLPLTFFFIPGDQDYESSCECNRARDYSEI